MGKRVRHKTERDFAACALRKNKLSSV